MMDTSFYIDIFDQALMLLGKEMFTNKTSLDLINLEPTYVLLLYINKYTVDSHTAQWIKFVSKQLMQILEDYTPTEDYTPIALDKITEINTISESILDSDIVSKAKLKYHITNPYLSNNYFITTPIAYFNAISVLSWLKEYERAFHLSCIALHNIEHSSTLPSDSEHKWPVPVLAVLGHMICYLLGESDMDEYLKKYKRRSKKLGKIYGNDLAAVYYNCTHLIDDYCPVIKREYRFV